VEQDEFRSGDDLVDDLATEFHHVEGVEHRDGLGELVADRVGVAVERVQRRGADPAREPRPLLDEPVAVGGPGATLDQVQQSRPGSVVFTAGVVHDAGDQPGAGRTHVAPDVLVHAQGVDPGQPVLCGQLVLDDGGDGVPDGVPGDPEHIRQGRDGDVVGAQLSHRPSDRPGGELAPRCGQLVNLAERRDLAGVLKAPVASLAPHHPNRHSGAG